MYLEFYLQVLYIFVAIVQFCNKVFIFLCYTVCYIFNEIYVIYNLFIGFILMYFYNVNVNNFM